MHSNDDNFDVNGLMRWYDDGKWFLRDVWGRQVGDCHGYIELWGEGYYKVERGAKRNIMRPDGTLVLEKWHHDVYRIQKGILIFGDTIRKSKTNPKTRYIRGVASVKCEILFPTIFERVDWLESGEGIYGEIGTKPYIINLDGSIIDPAGDHLPPKLVMDWEKVIRKITPDDQIVNTDDCWVEKDNFPFSGVNGSICAGCVFSKEITPKADCCGRLSKVQFRENYLKGVCIFRKHTLTDESEYERRQREEADAQKRKEEKTADTHAVALVKDFIREELDGDIYRLRDFDFTKIKNSEKFGQDGPTKTNIEKAIIALVFGHVWPDLNVYNLDHYVYMIGPLNLYVRLMGSNIMDEYFMGLQKFSPSEELHKKAVRVSHLISSIGNLWVLPNKTAMMMYSDNYKFRNYPDRFLQAMYNVFTESGKIDWDLKGHFFKNRKMMVDYQGEEGFRKLVKSQMLEAYVGEDGLPTEIFPSVWLNQKGLERDTYLAAVEHWCDFCEKAILERAARMIQTLDYMLS